MAEWKKNSSPQPHKYIQFVCVSLSSTPENAMIPNIIAKAIQMHHTRSYVSKVLWWNIDKAFSLWHFHLVQYANNFWQVNKNKPEQHIEDGERNFLIGFRVSLRKFSQSASPYFDNPAKKNEKKFVFLSLTLPWIYNIIRIANGYMLHTININVCRLPKIVVGSACVCWGYKFYLIESEILILSRVLLI